MVEITVDILKRIHTVVEITFPTVTRGIKDEGLLDAAVKRPSTVFGDFTPFDDIYSKAASIMEAITRWHPFIDGNKRTGLLGAFVYLYMNDHYLAIPLDAVRFTVTIAENKNRDWEETKKLIGEIAVWLKDRSGTYDTDFLGKLLKYTFFPAFKVLLLQAFGFKKRAKSKLNYWFAVDIQKDYEKEVSDVTKFLINIMKVTMFEYIGQRKRWSERKKALQN